MKLDKKGKSKYFQYPYMCGLDDKQVKSLPTEVVFLSDRYYGLYTSMSRELLLEKYMKLYSVRLVILEAILSDILVKPNLHFLSFGSPMQCLCNTKKMIGES